MRKIVHNFNFVLLPEHGEDVDPVSETVPGDSYSVVELMERYRRGQSLDVGHKGQYDPGATFDSDDLEEVNRMDLAERSEYKTLLEIDIAERKAAIAAVEKATAEKAAAEKAAIKKRNEQGKEGSHERYPVEAGGANEERMSNDSAKKGTANRVPPDPVPYSREGEGI